MTITGDDVEYLIATLAGAYVIGWTMGYMLYLFKRVSETI